MERSAELEELVGSWFGAATRGDASLVDALVSSSPDARLTGSAPEERFAGGSAIKEFLRGEVEGAGGKVTFTPSGTEAFSEGSVGWASTSVTIAMPDGRTVPIRWSAVFHQEDSAWKFVQTHASIGISNDEVGWVYPG